MIIAAANLTGANPLVIQALRDLAPQPLQNLASGAILREPARTIAGRSNLRSGLRRQYPVEIDTTPPLALLAGAGLTLSWPTSCRRPSRRPPASSAGWSEEGRGEGG